VIVLLKDAPARTPALNQAVYWVQRCHTRALSFIVGGALAFRMVSTTLVERLESMSWYPIGVRHTPYRSRAKGCDSPPRLGQKVPLVGFSKREPSKRDIKSKNQIQTSQNNSWPFKP